MISGLFFFFGSPPLTLKLSEQKQWHSGQKYVESCTCLFHLSLCSCLKVKEEMYHGMGLTNADLLRAGPSSEGI